MRVSRQQADENRETVVKAAGRLFRERGFEGVPIAEVMKAAGLTHGGFYGQFASKMECAVEACQDAFAENRSHLARWTGDGAPSGIAPIVEGYLSDAHRDGSARGCTFAALAADAARSTPEVKSVFAEGLRAHRNAISASMAGDAGDRDRKALATLATLVGALLLARAVGTNELSSEVLAAARDGLVRAD